MAPTLSLPVIRSLALLLAFVNLRASLAQEVEEVFASDPIAGGRFIQQTAGTESSFAYNSANHVLTAVLDVDRSPAYYLSTPFPTVTHDIDSSFSAIFRVDAIDDQQTPTAFIGLVTSTHIEGGGDGLTINLATSEGRLVALATIDDNGGGDASATNKFGGSEITIGLGADYFAIGSYVASNRTFNLRIYDGPDFTRFVGRSVATLPTNRVFSLNRLGLQNGGARVTDQDVGSMSLTVRNLSCPGHVPLFVSVADASGKEGNPSGANLDFEISLSSPGDRDVIVNYSTRTNTALAGTDYAARSGTLVFKPGITNQTVSIPILNDTIGEPAESMRLVLSAPVNATLLRAEAEGTILDDDTPRTRVSDAAPVEEQDTTTTNQEFSVTLSNPSTLPISVNYSTGDGSAVANLDYVPQSGSVAFSPGQTNQTVTVVVLGDTLNEPDEIYRLDLSTPVNATLEVSQAWATILDNDREPLISANSDPVLEGDSGTMSLLFKFTLAHASARQVSLAYRTADETATNGVDYVGVSGTLVFPPGTTSQSLPVTVLGDRVHETDESLLLMLSNASYGVLETNRVRGVILNDDPLPELTISDVQLFEGHSGVTNAVFTVRLSRTSSQTVGVDFQTVDGTATATNRDYVSKSGRLTFPPGTTLQTISIEVLGDLVNEADETFSVSLSNPSTALIKDGLGQATIWNDDGATLRVGDISVVEGNSGTVEANFLVTLSIPSADPVLVDYATSDETATAGLDYVARNGPITFFPGSTNQTVTILVKGDTLDEPNETFRLTLSNPVKAMLGTAQAVCTIIDDDPPSITINDAVVYEGDTNIVYATFDVTLSSPFEQVITVDYRTVDDTATAGSDYRSTAGRLTFLPGITNQTVVVPVLPDTLDEEDDEYYYVQLSNPVVATIKRDKGKGTIIDNDPPPTLFIQDMSVGECDQGTSTVNFSVGLSEPSDRTISIDYRTGDDTAKAGQDYAPAQGQIVFEPGVTNQTITFVINCDLVCQGDRGFWFDFSGGDDVFIPDGRARVTIIENDPPGISIQDATVREGDTSTTNAVLLVTLSSASDKVITVDFALTGGTATSGVDYLPPHNSRLVFAPGSTAAQIVVPVLGDTATEDDETIRVDLSNPTNATLINSVGFVTIIDDDFPIIRMDENVALFETDDLTNAVFKVSLSRASARIVTVDYLTENGTAEAGTDYVAVSGTLTFSPGETNATVSVVIQGDTDPEPDEVFFLRLKNALNGNLRSTRAQGTILNDDGKPRLIIRDLIQAEGNSSMVSFVLALLLDKPSSEPVSVTCTTVDGTAVAGVDYQPRTNVIKFPAGSTLPQRFSVNILGDTVHELDETLLVRISNETNCIVVNREVTVTIRNDDPPPEIAIADAVVTEGNTHTNILLFPVQLSRPSSEVVSVAFTTQNGTASAGSDYIATTGILTFLPGTTNQTISVVVNGDTFIEPDENLFVELSSPEVGTLKRSRAQGVIRDDDDIVVRISDATVNEGNSGTTDIAFTVTLSNPANEEVSVLYTTEDGTALAGLDYVAANGKLVFPPGTTNLTLTLAVKGDTKDEPDKTFHVVLGDPVNARRVAPPGTGTIIDDDPPEISVNDVTVSAVAGNVTATFTVSLSSPAEGTVTVACGTASGTATTSDFEEISWQLTFSPGVTNLVVDVGVRGNSLDEATEVFHLILSRPQLATLGKWDGICTILNTFNTPPEISAIPDQTINEDSAAGPILFTVRDAETSADLLKVSLSSTNLSLTPTAGLALGGTGTNRTLTITPAPDQSGQTRVTVTVEDSGKLTSAASFLLVVTPVNDPPVAQADTKAADEDTQLKFPALDLLSNDSPGPANESSQKLTLTAVTSPTTQGGAVRLDGTNVVYLPATNFFGTDSFTYTVTDNGTTGGTSDPKSATATVTLTVRPVNDPPVAQTDTKVTDEDTQLKFSALDLLSNDSPGPANESSQKLTLTAVTSPTTQGGTVRLEGTNVVYLPATDFFGTDSFTYTLTDNGTTAGTSDPKSATGTVTLTVRPVNDPPVAQADTKATDEDTQLKFPALDLLSNDSPGPANESGQKLTLTAVASPTAQGGTVRLEGTNVVYLPATNFFGTDSFAYTLTDNGTTGGTSDPKTATGVVTLTVRPVNDPPIAQADTKVTAEDTQLKFPALDLLSNDSPGPANESSQKLTATAVTSPTSQGGTVRLEGTNVVYLPATNFFGTDSFTYTVTDNGTTGGTSDPKSATATVTISVGAVNASPIAQADAKATDEDAQLKFPALDLLSNDSPGPANESSQKLTVTAVTSPTTQGGAVRLDGTNVVYLPATNFFGTDSFTYTVTDNGTTGGTSDPKSATGTVTLTVRPVNDPPVAQADSKLTDEDTQLKFPALDLLSNDSPGPANESGQKLTVTAVTSPTTQGGTVRLEGTNVVYLPATNFFGTDSFTYTVADNGTTGGTSDPKSATGTVTLTVRPVNDPPVAQADAKVTAEDTQLKFPALDILSNDSQGPANENGQKLTVTAVTSPTAQGGTVRLDGTNVVYLPATNFFGTDSFTYTIADNGTTAGTSDPKSATATVTISVGAVNAAPLAQADAKATDEDAQLKFPALDLLSNDSPGPANESGQKLTLTAVASPTAQGGTVRLEGTNVVYLPATNFFGTDSFSYTVTDDGTTAGKSDPKSATATVTLTVRPVNDPPVGQADAKATDEDTQLKFPALDLLSNDSPGPANESGQKLTLTAVTSPTAQGGTVRLEGTNVVYLPATNFFGTDSFTYTVTDNGTTGGTSDPKSATATVTLTVSPVNDPPVAQADTKVTDEDTQLKFPALDLLSNDSPGPANESGQKLTVTAVTSPTTQGGTVRLEGTNVVYLPATNFFGTDSFTYTVADNGTTGGTSDPKSATGTVTLTVRPVNDPPVAQADAKVTAEDTQLKFPALGLLSNDSPGPANESGQKLTVTAVTSPTAQGGTVRLDGTNLVYLPATNFFGTDSFTYTVTDNGTTGGTSDPKSATATVTLTVSPVNDPPVAQADTKVTAEDTQLKFPALDLLSNDSPGPANESDQKLTLTAVTSPTAQGGTVRLDGTNVVYLPATNFFGTDSFSYTVTDDGTTAGKSDPKSATGTVTLTVRPVNDPPVAQADSNVTDEDTQLKFPALDLLSNDSPGPANENDQKLTLTAVTSPTTQGGTVRLEGTNLVYLPATNFFGTDSFTYTTTDNGMTAGTSAPKTATATVSLTVRPVNDPPVAQADSKVTDEDTQLKFPALDLLSNDSPGPANENDQKLTLTAVSSPTTQGGTVRLEGTNVVYLPATNFFGTDSFTYTATDNGTTAGASAPKSTTGTVTVSVRGTNRSPLVTLTYPVNNATFISGTNITLVAEATDPDGKVTRVEFLSAGTLLGDDSVAPYAWAWRNVPSGVYVLSARAADDKGATAISPEITITVRTPNATPPTVLLTSPTNYAVFQEGENVSLTAAVTAGSNPVAKVEFYAGSLLLGETDTAPYTFVWEMAPEGDYQLTARAIDSKGLAGESSPIRAAVGTCGRVAIVRSSAHPEIEVLQGHLFELGLKHEIFERAALRVNPTLRNQAAALELMVWDETGGEALKEEDVLWLQDLVAKGHSVYFIGEGLISAAAGLSETTRRTWYELLHLEPATNPVGAQTVVIDQEANREITLVGHSGSVTNFTCAPLAKGSQMAYPVGIDTILGRMGDNDVLVANEYIEHSGRCVTQLLRVYSGTDPSSIEERGKLFENAVWWLMRCRRCGTLNIGVRDDSVLDPMNLGEEMTYGFVVYQDGECGGSGVRVVVELPQSLQFVRATSERGWWSYENGRVSFFLGRMPSAAQQRVEVTVLPTEPGEVTASARVAASNDSGGNQDDNQATATIQVVGVLLRLQLQTGGRAQISIGGPEGRSCTLQGSLDLSDWKDIKTVDLGSGWTTVADDTLPRPPRRFYRAKLNE